MSGGRFEAGAGDYRVSGRAWWRECLGRAAGAGDRPPTFAGLIGTPEQIAERLHAYKTVGVQEVHVTMRDAFELDSIELLATCLSS